MADGLVASEIVNNIRIAEDAVVALVIGAIIFVFLYLAVNTIKEGPLFKRLIALALSFIPFFLWKVMGAYRRIFLDKSSEWYVPLHDFGEVMEGVAALFILGALIYMYQLVKPKELSS